VQILEKRGEEEERFRLLSKVQLQVLQFSFLLLFFLDMDFPNQ
jgi:hypothetical protein